MKTARVRRKIDGNIKLKYSEQMTFRAFAFGEYDNSSGISEVDWYNAQVAFLNAGSEEWQWGRNLHRKIRLFTDAVV